MDKLIGDWHLSGNGGHVSMKMVACVEPNPTTTSLELETGGQSSPEIGPCRGCIFKLFLETTYDNYMARCIFFGD